MALTDKEKEYCSQMKVFMGQQIKDAAILAAITAVDVEYPYSNDDFTYGDETEKKAILLAGMQKFAVPIAKCKRDDAKAQYDMWVGIIAEWEAYIANK